MPIGESDFAIVKFYMKISTVAVRSLIIYTSLNQNQRASRNNLRVSFSIVLSPLTIVRIKDLIKNVQPVLRGKDFFFLILVYIEPKTVLQEIENVRNRYNTCTVANQFRSTVIKCHTKSVLFLSKKYLWRRVLLLLLQSIRPRCDSII